jgi:hypothetical protein
MEARHRLPLLSRHKHYTPPTDTAPDLFTQEPPSAAVDTSEAAALKVQVIAGTLRAIVLGAIRSRGSRGATERELEHLLALPGNTIRPRLWELEGNVPAGRPLRQAFIYKSDEKRDGMRVYKAKHL